MDELEGIAEIKIPYKEYVELSLTIPNVDIYEEDVPLLEVELINYGKWVHVIFRTMVIEGDGSHE